MVKLRLFGILLICAALPGCSGCRPTPSFSADSLTGDGPLEVTFTDTSVVRGPLGVVWDSYFPITSWDWSFGDGGGSTTQDPTHTFEAPGAYTVSLTVANGIGTATATETNLITVTADVPTASFTVDETGGDVPFDVSFTDTSVGPGAAISAWRWDFGDGGGSTEQNPTHRYTVPGTYTVALTVTNAVGSDTETRDDLITVALGKPRALFTATPRSGTAPLTVQFTDTSVDGSADITEWSWSFGNGVASDFKNPVHTYGKAGTYNIRLTVTSPIGSSTRTENAYITVLELPSVAFEATPDDENPLRIVFTDTSTPGSAAITEWIWNFDDGTTSTESAPTHIYAEPGTYNVRLTVKTEVGGDSRAIPVVVEAG